MGYDIKVKYKKGGEHVVVCVLSRRYETKQLKDHYLLWHNCYHICIEARKNEVATKPNLQALYSKIQQGKTIEPW